MAFLLCDNIHIRVQQPKRIPGDYREFYARADWDRQELSFMAFAIVMLALSLTAAWCGARQSDRVLNQAPVIEYYDLDAAEK